MPVRVPPAGGSGAVCDTVGVMSDDQKPKDQIAKAGAGVAIGAGVGTALFAATSSPVWIGVGVAIGAAIGAAAGSRGRS